MGIQDFFSNSGISLGFNFQKRTLVGIDVGVSSIKIVKLKEKKGQIHLDNYAIVSSDEVEFIKAGISGVINQISKKALKKGLERAKITDRKVNVAVPGFTSLIATIDIPQTSKKQADKIVSEEISKYIPVPLEEVVYGWKIISNIPDENGQENGPMKAIVVAIMKIISNSYQEIFQNTGLEINSLELSSFSLARVFKDQKESCIAILDIGKSKTNVVVCWEGNVLFDRTIDLAGDKITESISNSLEIDFKRAELMKTNEGTNNKGVVINQIVIPVLNILIKELKLTLESFKKVYPTIEPTKIILTGGTARLKGLKDFLQSEFKQKIEVGNPWKNIVFSPETESAIMNLKEFFSVAIGLALADFEDFSKESKTEAKE